jgi:membrane protease YdiL (CAAX protease family)
LTRTHPAPHRQHDPFGKAFGALKEVVLALVLWFLWQLPVYAFLQMPPRLSLVWLISLGGFFAWCYAAPNGWGSARGRANTRVRPVPRKAWPWLAVLAPVMAVGAIAMWMVITSLQLARDTPLPQPVEDYGKLPGGTLVLVVLIAALAPMIEEFSFRGWVQRPLERRYGPAKAIAVTSFIFALAHFEPGGIPIRAAGGAALGYAVWATGSIWSGVALHMTWNAGVLLFGGLFPHFDPSARGRVLAIPAGLVFLACAAVYVWVAPRLRAAGQERRTQRGDPVAP